MLVIVKAGATPLRTMRQWSFSGEDRMLGMGGSVNCRFRALREEKHGKYARRFRRRRWWVIGP